MKTIFRSNRMIICFLIIGTSFSYSQESNKEKEELAYFNSRTESKFLYYFRENEENAEAFADRINREMLKESRNRWFAIQFERDFTKITKNGKTINRWKRMFILYNRKLYKIKALNPGN